MVKREEQPEPKTERQKYSLEFMRDFCKRIHIKRCILLFRKKDTNLGIASKRKNRIILNAEWIEKEPLYFVDDLLKHEILHLKAGTYAHHGKQYKRLCRNHGCNDSPVFRKEKVLDTIFSVLTDEQKAVYDYLKHKYRLRRTDI
jgi:predicted SprT family Zn-dependent metalloprotease